MYYNPVDTQAQSSNERSFWQRAERKTDVETLMDLSRWVCDRTDLDLHTILCRIGKKEPCLRISQFFRHLRSFLRGGERIMARDRMIQMTQEGGA